MSDAQIAGRYTLVREVGRGGMGAVWLARDEVLGRDVAMKTLGLFPGSETPDLHRAEREATLAAALSHPNVVTVFDFVADGDERWLVMEYVEGTTLSRYSSERGGLPPDEARRFIRQAAEALSVAHAAGIVHRDVKPSNLIVSVDGTLKLTDFGIARGSGDQTLTQGGTLTGSPAYLAPEVAAGGSATEASDVWSLGATAYQAMTGRPPYEMGDNVLGGLVRIVNEPPPRLPDAGPLGTVLEATMVKDPAQRWTAAQLCAFLDGLPAEAAGGGTQVMPALPLAPAAPPAASPAGAPGEDTVAVARRRPVPVWPLAATAAVLAALFAVWLIGRTVGSSSPQAGPTARPSATTPRSAKPTPSPNAAAAAGPTAAGMRAFVRDYLGTVTSDRRAAFAMLTPGFRTASGGWSSYDAFWSPIRGASVSRIQADPESLVVSYHVTYDGPSSRPSSDDVELQLDYRDGRYLIAGEG